MKKFEIFSQRRREIFTIKMIFLSVGNGAMNTAQYSNGAMNAPLCWQLRDDACCNVETSANTPRFPIPMLNLSSHCVKCIFTVYT